MTSKGTLMVAASKSQRYGQDYKSFSIILSPEEHRVCKMRSAQFGVTVTDVCRLALADEAVWQRAQDEKQKKKEDAEASR